MKKKAFATILALLVMISGCGKMVDSYMDFTITQFEGFLSASDNEEADYIAKGKLDFAKTGGVFFVPFIKETTHEECTMFVYIYWSDSPKEILITDIGVVSQNDISIFYSDSAVENIETIRRTDALSKGVLEIGSFPKREDWFLSGNKLYVSFSVSVSTEDGTACNDYAYEMSLEQRKSVLLPT
jgi:hypothetical protein